MNEEIKNRILMEMNEFMNDEEIKRLKRCLDRNFYGYTILCDSTDIMVVENITNEKMINQFKFERGLEGTSQNTLSQYVRETNRFFNFVEKSYKDVTSDDIQYYLYSLMDKGNMSSTSVDNARKFLKPFFKWLYENGKIQKDIFIKIKPIKRIEKPKDFLSDKEIVSIRDCCKNDIRGLALVDTLLSTGIRVSECSNLKLDNIDFSKDEINIYSTKTNTHRKVYLDSNAKVHLLEYLNTRKDNSSYVFVNIKKFNGEITNMKKESIEKLVQKHCKEACIDRKCNVHLFRKTMATRLYRHGVDIAVIAKILGHSSIKTTEKFYLSICDSDVRHLYQKFA